MSKSNFLNLITPTNNIAITDSTETITYRSLLDQVKDTIRDLSHIKAKDIVWLESSNTIKTLIYMLALWEKDTCVVPIDNQLGLSELNHLEKVIAPHHILYTNSKSEHLKKIKITTEKNFDTSDAAIIQLSSGTTGFSKIMLIGLDAIQSRALSIKQSLDLGSEDKTLCSVPLSHSHGIDCLAMPTLLSGGELHLKDPTTFYPYRILDYIETQKITFFSSLPQMYSYFNELADKKKYDLSSLKNAFCGSAALSEQVAQDFYRNFNIHLKQGYGLAEIGVICLNLNPKEGHYFSIGKPMQGIDWKIAADSELLVKSKSLFSGYYKNKLETESRFLDGFLKTEDLVSADDSDYLFITGRKNDFINVLGNKVYPRDIEKHLGHFSEIKDYCVASEKDTQRGEIPVLYLVAKNTDISKLDMEKKIIDYLLSTIEEFKVPKKIIWRESFPKSPLGKILKSKL